MSDCAVGGGENRPKADNITALHEGGVDLLGSSVKVKGSPGATPTSLGSKV